MVFAKTEDRSNAGVRIEVATWATKWLDWVGYSPIQPESPRKGKLTLLFCQQQCPAPYHPYTGTRPHPILSTPQNVWQKYDVVWITFRRGHAFRLKMYNRIEQ